MAKVIGLKQLTQKKYKYLDELPIEIEAAFGRLTMNFVMIIWGKSGNGKSNLIMKLVQILIRYGNVLYLSLEEGFEATAQMNAVRNLDLNSANGKVTFADHEMTCDELKKRLKKKKSPRFIIIDSLQYWNIDYDEYKSLKEECKNKSFIFISHARGKEPTGTIADRIRFDAPVKVFVKWFVAEITSRFGGESKFIIWEEGAKKRFGTKIFKQIQYEQKQKIDETKERINKRKAEALEMVDAQAETNDSNLTEAIT